MKRKLWIALAMAVLAALICCGMALADTSGTCGDNVSWTFNTDTGVLTISGTGAMQDLNGDEGEQPWYDWIENTTGVVIEDGVTSIGAYAFDGLSNMASVTIPDSVTSIGQYAFYDCSSLTSLTIPDSVTMINDGAFRYCSGLTTLIIPDSIQKINYGTFYSCAGLTDVTIPESVTIIDTFAFSWCTKLPSITIPASVTVIDNEAFGNCAALTSATIMNPSASFGDYVFGNCHSDLVIYGYDHSTAQTYANDNGFSFGVIVDGDITPDTTDMPDPIPYGQCGDSAYWAFDSDTGALTISGTGPMWDYDDDDSSFENIQWFDYKESITSVVIEDGVTTIGGWVFIFQSEMTSATIPDSVTAIGEGAFHGCSSLTAVTVPDGVTTIGDYVFSYCSALSDVNIPDGVTAIGDYAFLGCEALTSLTVPDSVTTIGDASFAYCTALTDLTVMNASAEFGEGVFMDCSSDLVITGFAGSTAQAYAEASGIEFRALPYGQCGDNVYWTFEYGLDSADGVLTIGGTGDMWDYTADGPAPWYDWHEDIISVVIDDGVTSIGAYAFWECAGLTGITIPDSVTSIGRGAFQSCSELTDVTVMNASAEFGEGVFMDCSSDLVITGFAGSTAQAYAEASGIEFRALPYGQCGDNVYWTFEYGLDSTDGILTISGTGDMWDYFSVNLAPWYDLHGDITSVVVEDGVTSIGSYAFYQCMRLTSVTIPDGVTSIGDYAFYYCTSLTSVTIPDGVTSIGSYVFYQCMRLTSVTIPDSVTSIGDYAFYYCKGLKSVTIPGSVTTIDAYAFSYSGLTSVSIPDGVTTINRYAFSMCNDLAEVYMSDTVTSVESSAFEQCSNMVSVTLSGGLTSVGDYAFMNCYSLTEMDIPDSLTSIGQGAFMLCSGMTGVTIPNSVTSIAKNAFKSCTRLAEVTVMNKDVSFGETVFDNCSSDLVLYGWLNSTAQTYAEANGITFQPILSGQCGDNLYWNVDIDTGVLTISGTGAMWNYSSSDLPDWHNYNGSITSAVIGDGVTSIGNYAFCNLFAMNNVTIPDSVTTIGDVAFRGCVKLSGLTLPNGLTTIGIYCFEDCSGLKSVALPDGMTTTGEAIFRGCTGLTSVTLPDSLTDIGSQCFMDCISLKSLTIPANVRSTGESVFRGCTSLTIITLPDSLTDIAPECFRDCTSLKNLTLPAGLKTITHNAFMGCTALTSVTLPNRLETIEYSAFRDCIKLTEMTIPASVTFIGDYAFRGCTALTDVTVVSRTASFGSRVFENCPSALILYGWTGSAAQSYANANGITFKSLQFEGVLSGSGTAGDPWLISSTADWNQIAAALKAGADTSGNYFRLTSNISVSTMIGTTDNYFHGHFDGAGHTLTVNLTLSDNNGGKGPFAYVSDASFERLHVTGTITTAVHDAAGLVGYTTGCSITDCVSSVHIVANAGNGHAGFIGTIYGNSVTIAGCVFTGYIEGDRTRYCSGFAGQGGGIIDNSFYDGRMRAVDNNNTFLRQKTRAANCYYTNTECIDRIKGKQARRVQAGSGVTIDYGTPVATYPFTGITAYATGLMYNGVFYAGPDDNVKLGLSAAPVEGCILRFSSSNGTLTAGNGVWTLAMVDADAVIDAAYDLYGSGTAGDPWLIYSTANWNMVASAVQNGTDTSGQYFRMAADVSVSTMIGTESNPFRGDFDGAGHTLTVSLTGSSDYIAPFRYVSDATFRNLKVRGTINVTGGTASGLAGCALGDCSVTNCAVDTVIAGNGGGGHTGFVSMCNDVTVSVTGSVFTGSISDPYADFCAGFLGWAGDVVENCVYDGQMATNTNSNDFIRTSDYAPNCYYTNSDGIDRIKGRKARSVTADEGITFDFGESTVYDVSGITAYPVGLVYNGVFYAGPGETVTLGISAAEMEDHTLRFEASAGSLAEADGIWTLAMPDEDVVISPVYEPLNGQCGEDAFWAFDLDTGVLTISGTGPMWDYDGDHPEDVGWFCRKESVTSVVIGDGVTAIGAWAFAYQSEMTSVTIPDGVTAIGDGAFYGCASLADATILYAAAEFGDEVFTGCSSDLVMHGWAESTAQAYAAAYDIAFDAWPINGPCGEGLTWTIDPLTGVMTISGTGPMGDYSSEQPGWYGVREFITAVVIEDGVTTVGNGAFRSCENMADVTIPDSVKSIGKSAFQGCSGLTEVVLPDSVTSLGSSAFRSCTGLTSVTIPGSVTGIGANAFKDCAPELVLYGEAGSTAEAYAAYYGIPFNAPPVAGMCGDEVTWSLNTATGTLTLSGTGATWNYSAGYPDWHDYRDLITNLVVEEGVTELGAYLFRDMPAIATAAIPEGVTSIGAFAFYKCTGLTGIAIPGSVTSIGRMAFNGCTQLADVSLAEGLTSIGDNAFCGCSGLTAVTISESVTSIGYQAFQRCAGLTAATILNPSVSIGTKVFADCSEGLVIYGYNNSTAQTYAERYDIPFESLIPQPTFYLPAALTAIEDGAFSGIGAKAVFIPTAVTDITGNPFAGSQVQFIYGYSGSAAEAFATAYSYTFVPVDGDQPAGQ